MTRRAPLVIGLTGSVGMGKSTVAEILETFGLPTYDADRAVHALLGHGGKAVAKVGRLFPGTVTEGAVDRRALGRVVFGQPHKLKQLEAILHPMVQKEERAFRRRHKDAEAVVLEIPLLFETGAEDRCDIVICVTAPVSVQRARVLRRPGMTAARFRAIVAQQMPDREKRLRADVVIDTGKGRASARRQLKAWWTSRGGVDRA